MADLPQTKKIFGNCFDCRSWGLQAEENKMHTEDHGLCVKHGLITHWQDWCDEYKQWYRSAVAQGVQDE